MEGKNFYIGYERMKNNGNGTVSIYFNYNTNYSVTVGKSWNGSFRFYKPVDVQETIDYANNLMTIKIKKK